MKILFIITGLTTGGAQTMLLKLLSHMDAKRFSPEVISLTAEEEMGKRIEALGIPVHYMDMKPAAVDPARFLKLVGLVGRIKPDLVHTWMYHADLLGGLAARMNGISALAWCVRHSDLSKENNKKTTLYVVKLCALLSGLLPRRIVMCSSRAAEIHRDAGYREEKMFLLPNGFNLEQFTPSPEAREAVRRELRVEKETQLVGLIARDDPQKNHAGFIRAAARVHQVLPEVHFILAGTGIDQDNTGLAEAIGEHNLQERMHLLGRRNDIPRLMASLDVLASSSIGEAFPNVLGEAMSCAVPCVVTDVGDSAEIVGDTGAVVDSGDMEGLARHLIEILNMPSGDRQKMGVRARSRVAQKYEINGIVRRYEEFYEELYARS
jgi:glycosyltransferase involved in cell wall biosynthesis